MYSKEEARKIKQNFWITFGRYMSPVPSAFGVEINWINYKTGVKDIYFRMDSDKDIARVSIEITHSDETIRHLIFEQFEQLNPIFQSLSNEKWDALKDVIEEGKPISKIWTQTEGVSILNEKDWPEIISFLKQRMMLLDIFWAEVKDIFIELNN